MGKLNQTSARRGTKTGVTNRTNLAQARRTVNRSDARYMKQEMMIQRGIEHALAKRRIGLKTTELCRDAKIASPTFYLHYKNCDEALVGRELAMEESFVRSLPQNMKKDAAFTKLLAFVIRHQHYFAASFRSRNFYLLVRLIQHAIPYTKKLQHRAYTLYVWSIGAVIFCFGECDRFSEKKAETYRQILMKLRMIDWWN